MLRGLLPVLLATLLASPVSSQVVTPPDENSVLDRAVPGVALVDDAGHPFTLGGLSGRPLVLSPIFTRCPGACPAISTSLRDALARVGVAGVDYDVVTVSFDPGDTAEDLRAYRERLELPESWYLATAASPGQLDTLLSAIDFRFAPQPDGGFAHPNVVAVLTPDHHVSGFVHGTAYEEAELRRALLSAVAPSSLVEWARPVIVAVSALCALTALVILWVTKRRPLTNASA